MAIDFPRGSIWRKWDLHIHSPLSLLNNSFPHVLDGSPDWDAYISKLEASDLSVIGITDYFTIDGYKKVRESKQSGRLTNVFTVLPNIEFRLDNVVASKKDGEKPRRLNFHVIFSDEVDPKDIEEHFLHDLEFYYEASPQNKDQTRKLKVSNIVALGKKLIEENPQFRDKGEPASIVGARTTVVKQDRISEILASDARFKDKYLLIFPEELSSMIEWGKQDHVIRQVLLQKSDMIFSSNRRTIDWCIGAGPYEGGPSAFVQEFKSLKPCIHGSDAHDLNHVGKPCARRGDPSHDCNANASECDLRFCWIKSDPTFEGLKQLKYEPSDRVKIQTADPTPLKSNSCLTAFRMERARVSDELSLEAVNFPLNQSLVAVTGGKGAGKTAFVDIISNHFRDRCNTSDPNSFVRRVTQDSANFNTSITLGDGTLFQKALRDNRFIEQSEIIYIAQGELENYIGQNSDLDKYIRDLIFESPETKDTVKAFELEKLSKRSREIEAEIAQQNRRIQQLEERTAEKVQNSAKREKTQTEAELRDVQSKIPDLQARLTKENIEVIEKKQAIRTNLQGRKLRFIELGDLLTSAKQFLSEDLSRFNLYTSKISDLLRDLGIEGSLPSLEYESTKQLTEIVATVESQLAQVVAQIETSEKELLGYEQGMQEHARYLSRRTELFARLEAINKNLGVISADAERLETSRNNRSSLFRDLIRITLEQQQKYAEIIEVFSSQKAEVLSDLDFKAEVHFASQSLLNALSSILDNRRVNVFGLEDAPSEFQPLQELYRQVCAGDAAAAEGVVQETARLASEVKSKVKESQAISAENLYKALYGTYLSVVPVVNYKKTALNRLSLGQKATVLIKIYLAQGRNPIIIDSHDDHLDNEFIMDELVGAIRKAKTYRQVILASNNGNVVINSDAEQVIIADRQQGKISYICGAIENPTIRDRALKVLEGGQDAFKKRQEKYRIR